MIHSAYFKTVIQMEWWRKKLFTSFLQEEIPEYPISNEYWKNCAHAMNADLGSNRTGEA